VVAIVGGPLQVGESMEIEVLLEDFHNKRVIGAFMVSAINLA
jgi:hypothetical protein